jgi:hypothetical protein
LEIVVEARYERPDTVRALVEALPRLLCPVTVSVPLDVSDVVAVIDPPVIVPLVRVSKSAVTERSKAAKKVEDVPLVVLKRVIVPLATVRSEIVVVAKLEVPVAVSAPVVRLDDESVVTDPVVPVRLVNTIDNAVRSD